MNRAFVRASVARRSITRIVGVGVLAAALAGCQSNAGNGALIGAGTGAGVGAILGHQSGKTGQGAVIGGAIGAIGAWIAFDGFRAATLNWQTFSQVAFSFDVNGPLLLRGIISAVVIGLIGGLFPAIRAARLPVATALRE